MLPHRQLGIGVLLMVVAGTAVGPAQVPPVPGSSQPSAEPKQPEPDQLGRDTPYGCVTGFLRAASHENYALAADYLNVKSTADAQELARKLLIVLDVGLSSDLERLSKDAEGGLVDGLPPNRDRVGTIENGATKLDVILERVQKGNQPPIWLFSSQTLHGVPAVFEQINAYGLERHIPNALRETKILWVPLYRWFEFVLGVVLAFALAKLVTRFLIKALLPLIRRMTREEVDQTLARMQAPITVIFLAAGFRMLATFSIRLLARQFWTKSATIMAVVGFAWLIIRFSDLLMEVAIHRLTRRQRVSKLAVLTLLHRLFKIGVGVLAALVMLYASGKDVTTLLAGFGLGGIAIAFAAQKTLENLFGGVSIISDEPIRVGDFCKFGDKMGTVEDIGLRSTRVRTLDRTMLSIPNGQLAQMNIENIAFRDRFLCNHQIGLRYETTPDQLRAVLAGIRELLRSRQDVDQESARVRLTAFAASSLNMEVFAYLSAIDYPPFLEAQEDLLLGILDIIVACGSGLAFPSQTTYIARDKAQDSGLVEQAAARIRTRQERARPASLS